ncbi:MAG: hypothetical protein ACYCU0_00975 [Solirubrobacteraceae bacterium]
MGAEQAHAPHGVEPADGEAGAGLPPVAELCVATLAAIVAGGIYLAASMPGSVTLAPAIVLLGVGAVLLIASGALLARVRDFAWRRFRLVFGWVLLSYVIIAGMLEYVFVYDGVSGGTLAVLSGMLLVFGLNVPLVISFTVARFVGDG